MSFVPPFDFGVTWSSVISSKVSGSLQSQHLRFPARQSARRRLSFWVLFTGGARHQRPAVLGPPSRRTVGLEV